MNELFEQVSQHWPFVAPLLRKPRTEADYDRLVEALDRLLERVGDDEEHPLSGLLEIVGDWVEAYDLAHRPIPKASGVEVLRYLMLEHGLSQSDLPGVEGAIVGFGGVGRQAPGQPAADPLVGRTLQGLARGVYLTFGPRTSN